MPDQHHVNYSMRQPIGPVGVITPWNTPFMLSTRKIAPLWQLAARSCTSRRSGALLPHPAERTRPRSRSARRCAQHGSWPRRICRQGADRASAHSCDRICWRVSSRFPHSGAGAPTLKRVHFELGGKNPVIVFDDADLERALGAVAFMIWSLNGELHVIEPSTHSVIDSRRVRGKTQRACRHSSGRSPA